MLTTVCLQRLSKCLSLPKRLCSLDRWLKSHEWMINQNTGIFLQHHVVWFVVVIQTRKEKISDPMTDIRREKLQLQRSESKLVDHVMTFPSLLNETILSLLSYHSKEPLFYQQPPSRVWMAKGGRLSYRTISCSPSLWKAQNWSWQAVSPRKLPSFALCVLTDLQAFRTAVLWECLHAALWKVC